MDYRLMTEAQRAARDRVVNPCQREMDCPDCEGSGVLGEWGERDCRRCAVTGTIPCAHLADAHDLVIGEAGDFRPCRSCRCPDYMPPEGADFYADYH